MNFAKQLAAALLVLSSVNAVADDRGLYLGGGLTKVETDEHQLSDDDNAYKAFVGYRLNPYLAVEGAWVDLGNFSGKDGDFEGHSLQAAAHFGIPVGKRVRLFASAGVHAWDADNDIAGDSSDLDMTYGLGVEVDVFRNIGVRLEQEVLKVGDVDLDQTSASAYVMF
ncbi:outer membrane beta-barrel protein [Pseudomonas alkylphenolica]|uniref:Outer membrane beta-barrel protein n=1 Tax=Pseudomonas alkylphenolica TaxID=237609 RepID=A0A6I6GZ60_9PSED|nr:outer membrane beta-barrel protein [Pseudomonas alkylphenolica]QGW79892.1 outer membrane beta-barrel protein [Pseudomonas alkylphenolica]